MEETHPSPTGARRFMLVVTGVAAVWAIVELLFVATGRPAEWMDYGAELTRNVSAGQPEGTDGWPKLIRAATLAEAIEGELGPAVKAMIEERGYEGFDYYGLLGAEPLDETAFRFEIQALDSMDRDGVFDAMARAAACPRFVRPVSHPDEPLMTFLMPNLARMRDLARIRVASMRMATRRGDHAETVAAFEQSLALARATATQAFLIDRLVGQAIFALVLTELRHELLEAGFDEITLRALLEAFDRQAHLPPFELAVNGERAMGLDLIQWSFSDNGHGNGQLDPRELAQLQSWATTGGGDALLTSLIAPFQADRVETTATMNEFYDALVAESKLDAATRAAKVAPTTVLQANLGYRHLFLSTLLPALDKAMTNNDETMVTIAGTRLMIALEIFRARHGRAPATLDELVPEIIPVPITDPMHGGAFIYRRAAADDSELPYLLYSTGVDDTDDSTDATPEDWGRSSTLRESAWAPGTDKLISRPRPPREPR